MDYIISPEANAKVAEDFGEAPSNSKACDLTTNQNHCDDLPRYRRVLVGRRLLLDDAHGRLWRRRGGLQDVRRLGELPGPRSAGERTLGPGYDTSRTSNRRLRVSRGGGSRRSSIGTPAAEPRRALGRAGRVARRRLPRLPRPAAAGGVLGHGAVHERGRPGLERSTTSAGSSSRTCTATSRCARSRWPASSQSRTPSSPSRSRTTWRASRRPRTRNLLVVAVLTPLWASYLVKAFAWNAMLSGSASSTGSSVRSASASPGDSTAGLWLDVHVLLAAVHGPARLRGPRADSPRRSSRRRRTWADARCARSAA